MWDPENLGLMEPGKFESSGTRKFWTFWGPENSGCMGPGKFGIDGTRKIWDLWEPKILDFLGPGNSGCMGPGNLGMMGPKRSGGLLQSAPDLLPLQVAPALALASAGVLCGGIPQLP